MNNLQKGSPYVLWLAEWYPNEEDPYSGDFIKRHAEAVSLYLPVRVLYVKTSPEGRNGSREIIVNDQMIEHIRYSPAAAISAITKLSRWMIYKQELKKIIEANGMPVCCQVNISGNISFVAFWLRRKYGIRFHVIENWTKFYIWAAAGSKSLASRIAYRFIREAELFLPVSNELGRLVQRQLPNRKFEVVPNVVNTRFFFPARQGPGHFRFIHASYLDDRKNPKGIIRAAAQLFSEGLSFELVFFGERHNELQRFAESLGLTSMQVSCYPMISYEQVAEEMRRASALVLFSWLENLPCILLEALCSGLPVVSSDVGGVKEAIDASNGILVPAGDEGRLAAAMREVLLNIARYNSMEIAESAALKYSYATVAAKLSLLYEKHKVH